MGEGCTDGAYGLLDPSQALPAPHTRGGSLQHEPLGSTELGDTGAGEGIQPCPPVQP